jgi:hypothetical protein
LCCGVTNRARGWHATGVTLVARDGEQELLTRPIPAREFREQFEVMCGEILLRRTMTPFRMGISQTTSTCGCGAPCHCSERIFREATTPQDEEAIWNPGRKHSVTGKPKDTPVDEALMACALAEGRRRAAPKRCRSSPSSKSSMRPRRTRVGADVGLAPKRFLVEEGVGRAATFWKLAQSLSVLYPAGTYEKRWMDGVLARKKGLGFG